MEEKPKNLERFSFLAPMLVVKNLHLTEKDTRRIKERQTAKMGSIALVIAVAIFLLSLVMIIYQGFASGWKNVEAYGLPAVIGQIISLIGSATAIFMLFLTRVLKNRKIAAILPRLALDIFYLSLLGYCDLCLYADAQMGFLAGTEAISPAILVIFILMLLQPAFWLDMTILNVLTSASILTISIICHATGMTVQVFYYIVVVALFPFSAHIVVSTLFYAEAQSYCTAIANERLHNKVLYDELTHCKSRVALKEFIDEISGRWETRKASLLLIMFDIDNFKLYNDQFSHISGDHCLQRVSDAIRMAFPSPSLDFFRYGGEEFLLFFELDEDDEPGKIMEKARIAIKDIRLLAPKGAPKDMVTISLGGAIIRPNGMFSFDKELELVDTYLYQAKSSGKDVCVLDGSIVKQ